MARTITRFTGMQHYLAHARNTVHVMFSLPNAASDDAFFGLVAEVVSAAPQLLWRESLVQNGHDRAGDDPWQPQCSVSEHDALAEADHALALALAAPLHDTGRPAFRAICQQVGDQSRIIFQTTHALMEGGDVADLLRGRVSQHLGRAVEEATVPLPTRIAGWLIVPLMLILFHTVARFERKDRSKFRLGRVSLNRADLRRAAKQLGVSQRDVAFAVVTHHRKAMGQRKIFAAYTHLPPARVHLCDDEFMNVRVDEVRAPIAETPEAYATGLADALKRRGETPIFVQVWQRRLCQINRFLQERAPWILPKALFGFAPYDVVLSFLPPLDPAKRFSMLEGAEISAGSDTGTAESCIFAASADAVAVTFWAADALETHIEGTCATAASLGIEARALDVH